ncbi:MAG: hypothetical protein FRX49_08507 [Trebouxia sp. A1-2]|nr:MAG: hypothetical protein FRX49_08507 [Trebouxia sp. A1-2]
MTTFSQLETVQKKIDDLDAKILNTEAALAATQSATDIDFLRKQLERYKEKIVRCEQETILLQGQASGPESDAFKLDQILNLLTQQQNPKAKPISEVGSAEANSVLLQLGFLQEDGNDMDPIAVPASISPSHSFDYLQSPSENDSTPALLDYHQQQLSLFEVQFGRSHFKMYDIDQRKDLKLTPIRASSRSLLMSIQLLRFTGTRLVSWTDLPPQQAYFKQAQWLARPTATQRQHTLDSIPEDDALPLKKMRVYRPDAAALAQVSPDLLEDLSAPEQQSYGTVQYASPLPSPSQEFG